MFKGLIILAATILLAMPLNPVLAQDGKVYKTVDENGNVVFTDTPPEDGTLPMDLPELSVIETDYPDAGKPGDPVEGESEERQPKTLRELRSMYRDFAILSPGQEESIWGTENQVVIQWGSQTPFEPGLTAVVSLDGVDTKVAPQGSMNLKLDRGEHTVQATLKDSQGRTVSTTDSVTFFIKQNSANFNRPIVSPNN